MKREEWSKLTSSEEVFCRAGGRRRYNAMRQRRAEARREAMARALSPTDWLNPRGLSVALARAFGVSRQTAWRDLQQIFYGYREYNFVSPDGELLFTVIRTCQGGPIVGVFDADGNEIRGKARRAIIRRLPRYHG